MYIHTYQTGPQSPDSPLSRVRRPRGGKPLSPTPNYFPLARWAFSRATVWDKTKSPVWPGTHLERCAVKLAIQICIFHLKLSYPARVI